MQVPAAMMARRAAAIEKESKKLMGDVVTTLRDLELPSAPAPRKRDPAFFESAKPRATAQAGPKPYRIARKPCLPPAPPVAPVAPPVVPAEARAKAEALRELYAMLAEAAPAAPCGVPLPAPVSDSL